MSTYVTMPVIEFEAKLGPGLMTNTLSRLLNRKGYLLADGATGTNLFNMGLMSGDAPELWNETRPRDILKLHQDAVDASSDLF